MSHPSLENRENPLYVKAMLFSIYVRYILKHFVPVNEFDLIDQLQRSSRSVRNNICEAQQSESRRDFVHKLKIADKEVNESVAMISTDLIEFVPYHKINLLIDLASEIAKLLGKSIATARQRMS